MVSHVLIALCFLVLFIYARPRIFVALALCMGLTLCIGSCSREQPIIHYQSGVIKFPEDPVRTTDALHSKSTPDEVIKAWVSTAVGYMHWHDVVKKQHDASR